MPSTRPCDRLDRRLAAQRLRGRHLRAVARALASGNPVGEAHGRLDCRRVWIGRRRRVRIAESAPVGRRDVADLALDLRARGADRRAEQLLAAYALAGDAYEVFRTHELRDDAARPVVIAIGGGVASGKSTLATAVSRRLSIPLVVADRVRDALLAPHPDAAAHEFGWSPEFLVHIYAGLFERADAVLASGRSVVLDACFPQAADRAAAAALALRHGGRFVFVHCDPPPGAVVARLRRRNRRDGGGWEALARAARFEPLGADEPGRHLRIDTEQRPARALREIDRATRERA